MTFPGGWACVAVLVPGLVLAQTPPPETAPPDPAPQQAPPDAVAPVSAVKADPGWARAGATIGFVGSPVPLGLAIASIVASFSMKDQTEGHWMIEGAALSAPLIGLLPTFGGRSAQVADDLAHAPRILRIVGWVLIGLGTVGLATTPAWDKLFELAHIDDGPSIFGAVTSVIDAVMAGAGVVVLSLAARRSATRAESPDEFRDPPRSAVPDGTIQAFAPTFSPVFAVAPGPSGPTALVGLQGTF